MHYLSITFCQRSTHTECFVVASTLKIICPAAGNDGTDTTVESSVAAATTTSGPTTRLTYNFADHLANLCPPFALTYWCGDNSNDNPTIIVALPPLTCDPKMFKISLGTNSPASTPATASVMTLREPIYFPASTPRRDARLVYRPSPSSGKNKSKDKDKDKDKEKDSDGYLFLVLDAVTAPSTPTSTTAANTTTSPPVVALRWTVSGHGDGGWREWNDDEKGEDCGLSFSSAADLDSTGRSSLIRNRLRGSFVESGKPFSVPIRCGLNWTRKSYLSCS
jgi:hypothetical protein